MFRSNSNSIPGAFQPPPNAVQMAGIGGGGILSQLLGIMADVGDEIPQWSYYPNYRDAKLRHFWKSEPILAGAIYAMVSRIATLGFTFEGKRRNTKKYYQDMTGICNAGEGLSNVFAQTVLALLTQDNGAFWYLDGGGRPDRPLRGRVRDIRFLDQAQCWRNIDPEYPVIYLNPFDGTYHKIHKTRVVRLSSMTQTDELARGLGFCAVSRVLMGAQIMRDIRQYKREKIAGQPSRGILLMNGLNPKQLVGALEDNKDKENSVGYVRFKGIDTLTQINGDLKAELIDLASVPDGFNEETDTNLYVNLVALGLGTDAREIWSATVTGATRGDAEVSDRKARGKGIGDLVRMITRAMNWHVIGQESGVEFKFDYQDTDEQKQKADLNKVKADTYKVFVDMGAIIPEEARAMAIADEILSESILANLSIPSNYNDASPVVDENTPELDAETGLVSASIAQIPESPSKVAQQERETEQLQMTLDAKNPQDDGETDPAVDDEQDGEQPPPNVRKRKEKAKNSDQGITIPINDGDIDKALDILATLI